MRPGVLSLITGQFAAEDVSIKSMVQKGEKDADGCVQLIFLTHQSERTMPCAGRWRAWIAPR